MLKAPVAAAVLFLAASVALAQPQLSGPGAGSITGGEGPAAILYAQVDSPSASSYTSQNFEPALDAYDNAAADDFVVPADFIWHVDRVLVAGAYFNGPGPLTSVDVTFYADAGGLPGAAECSRPGVVPVDSAGSLDITIAACDLAEGAHWVSVVANLNFTPNGQWGWTGRTVQSNNEAAWQNPGGGFASPCTTWGHITTCSVNFVDPDFIFQLEGTAEAVQTVSILEIPTLGAWGLAGLAVLLAAISFVYLRRRRAA